MNAPIEAGTPPIHATSKAGTTIILLLETHLLTGPFKPGDLGVSVIFWPHDGFFPAVSVKTTRYTLFLFIFVLFFCLEGNGVDVSVPYAGQGQRTPGASPVHGESPVRFIHSSGSDNELPLSAIIYYLRWQA